MPQPFLVLTWDYCFFRCLLCLLYVLSWVENIAAHECRVAVIWIPFAILKWTVKYCCVFTTVVLFVDVDEAMVGLFTNFRF